MGIKFVGYDKLAINKQIYLFCLIGTFLVAFIGY